MRTLPLAFAAALASIVPLAAPAQPQDPAAPAARTPPADTGFFRPAADPSLTAPRPQERIQPQPQARPAPQSPPSELAQAAAPALDATRWAEEQADRAERESERARTRAARAAVPAGAASTGVTNEQ